MRGRAASGAATVSSKHSSWIGDERERASRMAFGSGVVRWRPSLCRCRAAGRPAGRKLCLTARSRSQTRTQTRYKFLFISTVLQPYRIARQVQLCYVRMPPLLDRRMGRR